LRFSVIRIIFNVSIIRIREFTTKIIIIFCPFCVFTLRIKLRNIDKIRSGFSLYRRFSTYLLLETCLVVKAEAMEEAGLIADVIVEVGIVAAVYF
jgi:hypothetical protein